MIDIADRMDQILEQTPDESNWGVYMFDRDFGVPMYEQDADRPFEAACIAKLGIAYALDRLRQEDPTILDEPLPVTDDMRIAGTGLLKHFPTGYRVAPEDLIYLMLAESDNTAGKMIVTALGGAGEVNDVYKFDGLEGTHLEPLEDGRFYFGETNAREAALLMADALKNPEFSDALHRSHMEYGLRRSVSEPFPQYGVSAAYLALRVLNGRGPEAFYDYLANWRHSKAVFANKGGSNNDARHDVMAIDEITVVAALSDGWSESLPFTAEHPAYDTHAAIGHLVFNVYYEHMTHDFAGQPRTILEPDQKPALS